MSQEEQKEDQENNDQEKAIIWDLEVWKRAEQAQFKAYLKQLEFEYLSKLQEDFKIKEDEREKEFKSKINEINNLKNKLSKKINDLESRENKIKICEEELKIRINEVSKQIVNKDEEITLIKKNAKEEQDKLNKNITQLKKKLDLKLKEINTLEEKFNSYKKDMENSPMSTLKNEITRKQIQNDELEKQIKNLENEIKNRDKTIENLKVEIIKLRKTYETEKENMYKQRLEEIEKLKFDIYNQRTSSEEMKEIRELKEKIKELSNPKKNQNFENNNFNYMSGTMPMQYVVNAPCPLSPSQTQNKKIYTIISYNKRNEDDKPRNELEKLIMEKEQLLKSGMYKENDPLIFQLNNKIKRISESFGGN